jgi:outer membrane lipoprotein
MAGSVLVSLLVVKNMSPPHERPRLWRFIAEFIMLFLVGCATSSPFNEAIRGRVDPAVTPERVLLDYPKSKGREVLWGGRILESRNLVDSTELNVLAYPIDSAGEPQTEEDVSLGRFVVVQKGYLETATYAPGREITVYGRVIGVHEVALGATTYQQPVVAVMQLQLWAPAWAWGGPMFHFGIGFAGGF